MKSGFERDMRHGKATADEVCERQKQGREGPGRHIGYTVYKAPTGGKQAPTNNGFVFAALLSVEHPVPCVISLGSRDSPVRQISILVCLLCL